MGDGSGGVVDDEAWVKVGVGMRWEVLLSWSVLVLRVRVGVGGLVVVVEEEVVVLLLLLVGAAVVVVVVLEREKERNQFVLLLLLSVMVVAVLGVVFDSVMLVLVRSVWELLLPRTRV